MEADIAHSLKGSSLDPKLFWEDVPAEAVLVTASLLNRDSLKPVEIQMELEALRTGKENRFTGRTNWIHNKLD